MAKPESTRFRYLHKLPLRIRIAGIYLLLLAISHAIRLFLPDPWPAPDSFKTLNLPSQHGQHVSIRYTDSAPDANPGQPIILLIHGSPAPASHVMKDLQRSLANTGRVICPDLPGFGYSSRHIDDYSIEAHAQYLKAMLQELSIGSVHLVAYSMGGGAAIHLAAGTWPQIQSLSLISSIGVQELELLGDYHLNHAVHGIQCLFFWSLQELVPHMGLLDRFDLNVNYARNFFDSDQRPLRRLLRHVDAPTLIVHGNTDKMVPKEAALEHYRLIPQSHLEMLDGGHLMLFQQTREIGRIIQTHINDSSAGKLPTRNQAKQSRIEAAEPLVGDNRLPPARGVILIAFMVLIAIATLVSEDLACIGAGMLAARGVMGFFPAAFAAFAGIVIGDLMLFAAGRVIGRPAIRHAPLKWVISPDAVGQAETWFKTQGGKIIFTSRFLPGSRLPVYFTAGTIGGSLASFLVYFLSAAILWTPALVGIAMMSGEAILSYYHAFERYALWVGGASILILWVGVRLILKLSSFRGRRLILSRLKRIIHWEFWPSWLIYLPVGVYIFGLGVLRRHLTLFTAANPGIPAGGIIGESKSDILNRLAGSGAVARFTLVRQEWSAQQQVGAVKAFMKIHALTFPLVCKPDRGERGKAVQTVHDHGGLAAYLNGAVEHTIVQEYIHGHEYGVFYYRYPGEASGSILAVTDKHLIHVTGDGTSSLERLILTDPRASCMADLHLNVHQDQLDWIPAPGERVQLVEVGTHARGALFLDGTHLVTPEMTKGFDRVSRAFNGFYFGRYDVRVKSLVDFQEGKGFTVLELNGVTSEATSIYDPKNSLFQAWKVLMSQWRIAVEIGEINVRHGHSAWSPSAFLNLVFKDPK